MSGLDISIASDYIYFSVEGLGAIYRVHRTDRDVQYMSELGQPQKLAVDWITENVYYADGNSATRSIKACNFAQKRSAIIIPLDPDSQVSALTLDAKNACLFYALSHLWIKNSPSSTIYRSNLDGSEAHEILPNSGHFVTELTYDLHARTLFYLDHHTAQIYKLGYDGGPDRRIIGNLTRPKGLAIFENQLYLFTSKGYVSRCSLFGRYECNEFKVHERSTPFLKVSHDVLQPPARDSCENNTCRAMCVRGDVSAKCICRSGLIIEKTGYCEDDKVFIPTHLVLHLAYNRFCYGNIVKFFFIIERVKSGYFLFHVVSKYF